MQVRSTAVSLILAIMELVVLILVCASPWVYGAVHPGFEFLLDAGLFLLLCIWGLRVLLEGQLAWQKCPVVLCLAGLFLLGIWQLTPLPDSLRERIAPGTARLYQQLLPERPEVLPFGQERASVNPPAGSTLSLYPGATRQQVLRILAVFLLFVVVRYNLAAPASLRRLSLVALVNGTLLALFALVQFFTSEPQTLYWTYPALGKVFGPFINRNHFACYLNLCIGLGTGFVLSRIARGPADEHPERKSRWLAPSLALLHDPAALAACVALALMVSSMVFSLSRGGLLSLAGGVLLLLGLQVIRSRRFFRLGTGLLVMTLAVALAAWIGLGPIKARLATLWQGEAATARLPLWSRLLPIAGDFPLWGTGYGTFQHIETLYRTDSQETDLSYDHAHNDYLELLIEGGIPGLALGLLAIAVVYALGFRALRRQTDRSVNGLVAGALLAFTTLVLHSITEFGTQVPAITLLTVVVCAQLSALGSASGQSERSPVADGSTAVGRLALRRLAAYLGVVAGLGLGWMICTAGWKAHCIDRLRAAIAMVGTSAEPKDLRFSIACLRSAASLAPEDAGLQVELGSARLRSYQLAADRLEEERLLAASAALTTTPPVPGMPFTLAAPLWSLTPEACRDLSRAERQRLARTLLAPALRNYLQARDACPLLVEAQLGLAAHAGDLDQADAQGDYLGRVRLLAPCDPEVWYSSGLQELAARQRERTWESWRRSLELSDRFLSQILAGSSRLLRAEDIVAKVLPARPELLLAAATCPYPGATGDARQVFLEKALLQLRSQTRPLDAPDLFTLAKVEGALGLTAQGVTTYETLLAREPRQVTYRFEFARFLHGAGRLGDARSQLWIVLAEQPEHNAARELLRTVTNEMARGQ